MPSKIDAGTSRLQVLELLHNSIDSPLSLMQSTARKIVC